MVKEIPMLVKKFIETPNSSDQYQHVPEKCELYEVTDGLVAGLVAWNDDSRDATIYYDIDLWGEVADNLAPRRLEYEGEKQPKGHVNGFLHHHIDDHPSGCRLGYFINIFSNRISDALDLANKMAAARDLPLFLPGIAESEDDPIHKVYAERLKKWGNARSC